MPVVALSRYPAVTRVHLTAERAQASVMKGKISYQVCEDAIPRLTTTTNPEDLADCDLIIEVRNQKHSTAPQTGPP